MRQAAIVSDRVHGINNLRETAQYFLSLSARGLSLKLWVLLPDEVEERSDIGSGVVGDVRSSANLDQISVKRRVDAIDTAYRPMGLGESLKIKQSSFDHRRCYFQRGRRNCIRFVFLHINSNEPNIVTG